MYGLVESTFGQRIFYPSVDFIQPDTSSRGLAHIGIVKVRFEPGDIPGGHSACNPACSLELRLGRGRQKSLGVAPLTLWCKVLACEDATIRADPARELKPFFLSRSPGRLQMCGKRPDIFPLVAHDQILPRRPLAELLFVPRGLVKSVPIILRRALSLRRSSSRTALLTGSSDSADEGMGDTSGTSGASYDPPNKLPIFAPISVNDGGKLPCPLNAVLLSKFCF